VSPLVGETYNLYSSYTGLIQEDRVHNNSFRILYAFQSLDKYIPPYASVITADLTLTFLSYNNEVDLEACFIRKPWTDIAGTNGAIPR